MTPIRVLLVDDQPMIRTGFQLILEAEPDITVVGEAGDGAAAVVNARALRPDVILMDIRMPRVDGIQATVDICAENPVAKIIILTTFDLDEYVVDALRAGASGFLVKDGPAQSLIDGIRAVARGDAIISPQVTRRLITRFADLPPPRPAGPVPASLSELTERELDVLAAVSRGLSNAETARELSLSEATVKTHVAHVLEKLGVRDRVQAVIMAYESGFVSPSASS
jgi:DNA-binding NarL/FixJ family response regulator